MSRLSRINIPHQAYHVINRGNNKSDVFFDDEDFEEYLSLLAEYAPACRCSIHAYVLMTNHVHLLITPVTSGGISNLMQNIGRCYVRYINKKYGRTGTLWEGRFKSSIIDAEEYLFTCMRYIELNPVRARIVRKPGNYRWSSYLYNTSEEGSSLLKPHAMYESLGKSKKQRAKSYLAQFSNMISQDDLDLLRQAANGGWAVGAKKFKDKIKRKSGRRASPSSRGGDHKSKKFRNSK